MAMVLTLTTSSINYLEVLKDTPNGKIGHFRRGSDNLRTRVWNDKVELTSMAVEIERAKLEAVQDNTEDSGHLSQERAGRKQDSNGTETMDDKSALAAAVSNEASNDLEDEVFSPREEA